MSSSYSSLDTVLSQWANFTVRRFICVYLCVYCVFFVSYCIVVVSLWVRWGGPDDWSLLILGTYLPSVLWHCWLGHLTRKTRPRYDL